MRLARETCARLARETCASLACDEHVLFDDAREQLGRFEEFDHGVRSVEDTKVSVVFEHIRRECLYKHRRDETFESVRFAALRGAEAGITSHLRAGAAERRLLLPVVIMDTRLPSVVPAHKSFASHLIISCSHLV